MRAAGFLALCLLTACGGAPSGGTSAATRSVAGAVSGGGTCPTPDPVRDGPLVDAIRAGNAAALRAVLARDGTDARAAAALALIEGKRPEANEAACFAPYLT